MSSPDDSHSPDIDSPVARARPRLLTGGLGVLGALAVAGGVAASAGVGVDSATAPVLLAVGAVCVVGALLAWLLGPQRAVPATTARGVYRLLAANQAAVTSSVGLNDDPVYVPTGRDPTDRPGDAVRALYLPPEESPPKTVAPNRTLLGNDPESGLSLRPSGGAFLGGFHRDVRPEPSDDPLVLARQLSDAAVESFDLAGRVTVPEKATAERVVFHVRDGAFGTTGHEQPTASFLAAGLSAVLERPVRMSTDPGEGRTDLVVVCKLVTQEL